MKTSLLVTGLILFLVIALMILLPGCYTQSKAKQQFVKAAVAYPEIPTEYCSTAFPVNSNGRVDTVLIVDSAGYKEVIEELHNDLYNAVIENDSLNEVLKNQLAEYPELDSLCNNYKNSISSLKKQNADLSYRIQHIKPVIKTAIITDTIPDLAALRAAQIERGKVTDLLVSQTAATDKAKSGRNIWRIIALCSLAVNAIVIYLKFSKYKI